MQDQVAKAAFEQLFANEMPQEEARAYLISLYEAGETPQQIAAAASVMRAHAIALPIPEKLREAAIDVVGTGGDRSGSFNISTTVSLLLASMDSVVAKHGNRSITSRSGSADLLEALGINLGLSIKGQVALLDETGFCFIFAMHHHPAMKHIMPIRRSIEHRTIFNLLGPLTNPAGARKYLLGVFDPSYVRVMAEALLGLDVKRAYIVSSHDGMDEISLATTTPFAYVEAGHLSEGLIDPRVYGFELAPKEMILGGDALENAAITEAILSGKERGPKRDIVVLNAMFALFVDGGARDLVEAKLRIERALDRGDAWEHLKKIARLSQSLD
jgi:anthranilate phosphoribosyltransferase